MNPPKAEHLDQAGEPGCCDYCGNPLPPERQEMENVGTVCDDCIRWGEPCQNCGERGTMKHGDPGDCRSPDCTADKIDAAMDMLEDR